VIDQARRHDEFAWRRALTSQVLADLSATVEREAPGVPDRPAAGSQARAPEYGMGALV
jgi:hypothetical protein